MASTSSRPKTPRRSLKRQKSGIFESVFSYVSQEMSNFVASATGAPKNEDEEDGETEYGSEEEEIAYEERTEQLNDVTPAPKSRPKKMREEESSPSPPRKKAKSKAHRRSPSSEQLALASSSSAPRSILTRKPSKPTMPGSLIPFSPGSSAGDEDDDDELPKHVHFDGGSPETAVDLTGDLELTPRQSRAKSPQTPTRVKTAVERFSPTSDPSMLLPQHPISPSRSRGTPSPTRVDKGKAPAKPYDRTFRADLSFDADPELKIKRLEAEVRQLREELARHGAPVQPERDVSNTDFSFLAPAPPPPPPPPPPSTIFRVPKQSDNLDVVFTHVRAALRHKTPPKEKPINPAGPAGIATLGIAPDKMAAFLTELKTVKLKKTTDRSFASDGDVSRLHSLSAHAKRVGERDRDRSFASEGDVSRLDTTFSLSRSRIGADSGTGDKRKRLMEDHDRVAGELDRALKRRTVLSTSTRNTVSHGAGSGSGSTSFDSSTSSGPSVRQPQLRSQSQAGPSRTHTLVRDWREGTAAAANSAPGSMSSIPASTASSAPTSASSADAPTPSLCSDQDAESHDNDDPAPTTPPPHTHADPHNVSMSFRPPTPPLIRRSVDILPAEVHYEISLRPPHTETPVAIRGEMSTIVGDDDGEEDMVEDTPMPAAISVGEKSVFAKRAPVSPLPDKSPRRPLPPGARRSLSRSSRDSATPQPRTQMQTQTPVNNNTNSSLKSSKSARTAKGTPHPAKTMSGGSLPRRVLALSEDEDELAIYADAAPRREAYNPDQTFNFDESSMNLSMSILGSREGPRRVPIRQALPRTDPAVAAAARRLALAHSIGRSKKRDDSGSERTASPAEERGGMADATFTLDDLRTPKEARESISVGEQRAERSNDLDDGLDTTVRRTPRRSSPAKPAPTRTITRRRSTLDQELRRSSIASSIAISATGNASFSMLTGEELPPGMLDDDDDDTVNFLKRMGEGEGGSYDFEPEEEGAEDDDFAALEEHMYVGVGTRPKSGFLAHGGAGGPAVWADV